MSASERLEKLMEDADQLYNYWDDDSIDRSRLVRLVAELIGTLYVMELDR